MRPRWVAECALLFLLLLLTGQRLYHRQQGCWVMLIRVGVSVNCCLLLPSCTSLTYSVVATSSTPVSCYPVLARDQVHRLQQ